MKGPQDFLTETDLAVEALIRGEIARAFPGDAILGEEGGGTPGPATWVIDPIDGTANFARGVPHFCVIAAFCAEGDCLLGAIHQPVLDELYLARKGGGATKNGRAMRVSAVPDMSAACIEMGWSHRHAVAPYLEAQRRVLEQGANIRRGGSGGLALAHVAEGCSDGYLEIAMNSWDSRPPRWRAPGWAGRGSGLQKRPCGLPRGFGHAVAGDHPGDFVDAGLGGEGGDGGERHAILDPFLDAPVMVAERGDLGRMGDDQNLGIALGQRRQPAADRIRRGAADAAVDFVKDQRQAVAVGGQADLQRQEEARQLAAGGDLLQRSRGRARVGGDAEGDAVLAVGAGRGGGDFGGEDGALHLQGRELGHHRGIEPACSAPRAERRRRRSRRRGAPLRSAFRGSARPARPARA
nr:inositol monophosphatase family protein [Mangrovicoccus ximenensis]